MNKTDMKKGNLTIEEIGQCKLIGTSIGAMQKCGCFNCCCMSMSMLYRNILPLIPKLAPREKITMQLLGAGASTREAAAKMGITVKTIETYREGIKHKLKIKCSQHLQVFATLWVWNEMEERRTQLT